MSIQYLLPDNIKIIEPIIYEYLYIDDFKKLAKLNKSWYMYIKKKLEKFYLFFGIKKLFYNDKYLNVPISFDIEIFKYMIQFKKIIDYYKNNIFKLEEILSFNFKYLFDINIKNRVDNFLIVHKFIIDNNIKFNISENSNIINKICYNGDLELFKSLTENVKNMAKLVGIIQESGFNKACLSGNIDLVKFLSEYIFYINIDSLKMSCKSSNIDLVKYIFQLYPSKNFDLQIKEIENIIKNVGYYDKDMIEFLTNYIKKD